MEVHAPDHPLHTWKDFFIHIITITIGLLIAIGLEQSVEWFHHRHLVHQARENLREEMQNNQRLIRHDIEMLKTDEKNLKSNIQVFKQQLADPKRPAQKLSMGWGWDGTDDSAYSTARDTGALALMPYSEVQSYAMTYKQQQIVYDSVATYLALHSQAFAPMLKDDDLAKLTPADLEKLIDGNATVITQQTLVYYLALGLDKNLTNALKTMPQ